MKESLEVSERQSQGLVAAELIEELNAYISMEPTLI